MSKFLAENSICDTWCLCYDRLTYKLAKSYTLAYFEEQNRPCVTKNEEIHSILKCFQAISYIALKKHVPLPRSPRLLVCDTGLYMEQNDIGFITVAICGGYISKYPRLMTLLT